MTIITVDSVDITLQRHFANAVDAIFAEDARPIIHWGFGSYDKTTKDYYQFTYDELASVPATLGRSGGNNTRRRTGAITIRCVQIDVGQVSTKLTFMKDAVYRMYENASIEIKSRAEQGTGEYVKIKNIQTADTFVAESGKLVAILVIELQYDASANPL